MEPTGQPSPSQSSKVREGTSPLLLLFHARVIPDWKPGPRKQDFPDSLGRAMSRRHCGEVSSAKFACTGSLLKNPSTPLPSTIQGLKNPAIAVFWR
jgi:hypothetical protein